ncbi:MAG: proton-conducting transporter membrane subunit [Phycisphaeraceae bacterium]
MTTDLIILFCLIPLTTGLITVTAVNNLLLSRLLGMVSFASMLLLAVGLLIFSHRHDGAVLVSTIGDWPARYGINVVFDSLSGLLIAAAAAVSLGSYIHSFMSMSPRTERRYFHPLMQMLIFGVNLSFLTGDLFNLFVGFEVMLMASYALLAIGGSRRQLTQAYKYVLLNLIASTIFVMAAGMTYGMFGTLNMAELSHIVHTRVAAGEPMPTGFPALAVTLLIVFGLKGAFFPLWFWLPDTYYTAPIAVAGLFGGLLTKVGVYAVARTFPLIFAAADESRTVVAPIIAVSAAFTMFLGVLGAVSHHEIRRILSIHVISQVGYMVFGIAIGVSVSEARIGPHSLAAYALAGCVFYMIQHMVVKCSLFLCCGLMERHTGTDDLDHMGGLLKRDGLLALLFFIAAMSLVGLPPLSGFFGKLTIIKAGWEHYWGLSMFGLATGLLTLLSMLKIWSYAFWNPAPTTQPQRDAGAARRWNRSPLAPGYVGVAMLVILALFLGFFAEPVYRIAFTAGEQLDNPEAYIHAVLDPHTLEEIEYAARDGAGERVGASAGGAAEVRR